NENSAAMGAKPGTILVDTSTIAPAAAQEFAERANELGLHFLDAPLTGGQIGAENGTLTIMVGGNEEVFGKVKPVFEPMSKKIVYVGGPGMGQILKMANQIAGMLNVVGVAEALLFCRNAGVDLDLAVETLSGGASGSWAMENLGPRIVDRDFRPGFSAELQQKDLRYALETADKLKVPMPGTAVCNQLMRSVLAHGDGKLSFVAVSLVLERLAGLDLPIKKGK
ncbi:MAG: NAD(P)-dependent oxidoreductase, partial [bacterium]